VTEGTELPPSDEDVEVEGAPEFESLEDMPDPPVDSAHDVTTLTKVQASVWRLGPGGVLIQSVFEDQAAFLAEIEPNTIFFYGDLDSSAILTVTEETMQKVYSALAAQGLNEGQIVHAVTQMQHAGIYFKEAGA
jgi:hypothetical protein